MAVYTDQLQPWEEVSVPFPLLLRLGIVVPLFTYRILSIYRLNRFVMSTFYILADHHRS